MSTRNPTAMSNSDRLRALVFDEEVEYVEIVLDVLSFVRGEPHAWATTSVVEARRRASQEFFDLILAARVSSDPQFLRDLRQWQPDAVLVVTAPGSLLPREIVDQFNAGADEVVEKPFHPRILVARLNRLVLVRAQLHEVNAGPEPSSPPA